MKKMLVKAISLLLIMIMLFSFVPVAANAEAEQIDFSPYIVEKHPRLYITSFEGLKEKYLSDPVTAKWYNALLTEAKVISDGSVFEYDVQALSDGSKQRRIISSQEVLDRFYCLAFAAACEDSEALADRLWQEVDAAINLPNWHPRHWLETAEMMHSVAIAYDWCFKFWSDEQKLLMETKIYDLGVSQAVREYNGWPRWYRWHYGFSGDEIGTNWTIVCNTGVLVASLAFYDTNPTFYNTKINNAVRSMKAGLNAYSEDGSYRENLNYWNYATRNLIMATDAFESAIGGDFDALPEIEAPFAYDFSTAPGISVTPDFPIYANGPDGVFNYGDASGGSATSSPAFMWLANRYNTPHYTDYHLSNLDKKGLDGENIPLDLLWYEGGEREKTLSDDRLFEEHFASMRSSWNDDEAIFVALKGGTNGRPHQHYDIGTFVLDAYGTRFARALGAIDYDGEASRRDYYKGRTEGQNTVVINPDENPGQNTAGTSVFESFYSDNESAYAILNMTDAYSKSSTVTSDADGEEVIVNEPTAVTSARRGVKMYSDKTRIVVQDEFTMNEPSEYYWFMHTLADIYLYNNNRSAVLTKDGHSVYLNVVSNQNAVFTVMDAAPLDTSPVPEDQPARTDKKLAIHLEDVTDTVVAVEFIASSGVEPVYSGYITPLDSWHPENDVVRFGNELIVYGDDKPGRTVTLIARSPLGEVVAIDQTVVGDRGEYCFDFDLPENYENGIYSVFINGNLYKIFDVSDGREAGEIPVSYSISYELPDGFADSILVAAEYSDNTLVQLATGTYNHMNATSTVIFDKAPQRGSKLKFLFLESLESLTPLYEAKEIDIN